MVFCKFLFSRAFLKILKAMKFDCVAQKKNFITFKKCEVILKFLQRMQKITEIIFFATHVA
jgi:hypothetical protein